MNEWKNDLVTDRALVVWKDTRCPFIWFYLILKLVNLEDKVKIETEPRWCLRKFTDFWQGTAVVVIIDFPYCGIYESLKVITQVKMEE